MGIPKVPATLVQEREFGNIGGLDKSAGWRCSRIPFFFFNLILKIKINK